MRGFSLVYQVEKMSLVVCGRGICSSNPLVSDSTGIGGKTTADISVTCHRLILVLILVARLTSVALSELCHEVTIEHSLPHLCLLLGLRKLVTIILVESSNPCLVEHLLLIQLVDIWQHLMNS